MPTLSMFFGILIRMYYAPKEHGPAHIHAIYNEFEAVFTISDGSLEKGTMPPKQIRLVQAWIEIHREELFANWELCQNGEPPFKIEPLR
jgi:hypothetical protein